MHKEYKSNQDSPVDLESYYQENILPEFGINQPVSWVRHSKTDPDNFLHIFKLDDMTYALAFDDYPSDFSIARDVSVKKLKLSNGEEILEVDGHSGKYVENVTGAFMLFQVIDTITFNALVDYLEASFEALQRRWLDQSKKSVMVARDLLQLVETASRNHDSGALYALKNIVESFVTLEAEDNDVSLESLELYIKILLDSEYDYEYYSIEEKDRVADEIYSHLSKEVQNTIIIQTYEAGLLGQTFKLVSAMYAKVEDDNTKGISIHILFEDDQIKYPVDHFVNDDLKKYFAENAFISRNNIERHMPGTLQGYRLVEGSVYAKNVFRRELAYISY